MEHGSLWRLGKPATTTGPESTSLVAMSELLYPVETENLMTGLDIESWNAREDELTERAQQFRERWGEGPPYFSPYTYEFWEKLRAGTFALPRCQACKRCSFPPRAVCRNCWSERGFELVETPALGSLFTFTQVHMMAPSLRSLAPLVVGCVDLDEGVRVFSWVRDVDFDQLTVGDRCHLSAEIVLGVPRYVARVTGTSQDARS
jgi:uncharacterized OB-fold protein